MAKNITEEQCSINLGYANGWDYLQDKEKLMVDAILEKHKQLCHAYPEKHEVMNISPYNQSIHGFNDYKCKGCNFSYSVDSSD